MISIFAAVDVRSLFEPDQSLIETFVRGSITYLTIFFLMRVLLKRGAGGVDLPDLLVIVLVADAAQNGMAGEYTSITSGLILVGTIGGWAYALDWLAIRVSFFARMVHPPPVPLVHDGKIIRHNLRREMIHIDELMTAVRDSGGEELMDVRNAYLEGNGEISVILKDGDSTSRK